MRISVRNSALVLVIFFISSSAWAQVVAVRAGHLIDPATGHVATDQLILVENDKIKSVGTSSSLPADTPVVDLSREWVLPGLMDAHTHLTLTEIIGAPFESFYLRESTTLRGFRGLRNARDLLNAGFTTVREVGNDADYATEDVRRAIEKGWFDGPTILSAGKIIAPFGGQSNGIPPEIGSFWLHEYIDANSPEEMRKAVRENIYYGADLIKLVADQFSYHFSLEEIQAAVDEAHRAGRAVAVHVAGGEAADNVIQGGADSVEHGFELSDAQMELMKQKGTFLVGTEFPRSHLDVLGTNNGMLLDPAVLEPKIIDRLKRAYRIGVKMAFGTDTFMEMPNRTRADLMLDYLSVWRQAGVSQADILKCMTTNPAELLRISKQRGNITPGLAADIIATPQNPLDDIESLRKVNFVMKNGKIIRRPQK